ncbi:MAG: histidine kinase [Bacteroidota bacterium]
MKTNISKLISRYPVFHIVNTVGLGLFIVYDNITSIIIGHITSLKSFFSNTLQWLVVYFCTIILRKFYKWFGGKYKEITRTVVMIIVASFAAITFLYILSVNINYFFQGISYQNYIKSAFRFRNMLYIISYHYPLMIAWGSLYFGIKHWMKTNEEKLLVEKTEKKLLEANLHALRYQVNPHFLFNTLNSLIVLIEENKSTAQKVVAALSNYYRYSLLRNNESYNKLSVELDAVNNYLDIEKIRYEENLIVNYDIDEKALEVQVPVFILNPLVENAVKYGVKTSRPPLIITIKSVLEGGKLLISVTNSGHWAEKERFDDSESVCTGFGLNNIKSRLEYIYGDKHGFEIIKSDDSVTVSIIIECRSDEKI